MAITKNRIEKNLQRIREDIIDACARRGRSPEQVSILPVTKTVELGEIKHLLDLGLVDLAESRVQQLVQRAEELSGYFQRRRNGVVVPVRWHMVGHLQRNKVKAVLEVAQSVHSLDSLRLAEDLNTRAERMDRTIDVMLQVNCSEERQKFGCAVGAALHLGELICTLKQLRLVGLMTMGPLSKDPEASRPFFTRLKELFEEMQKEKIGGDEFRHLSMGMSQDYTVAVEEGATILRIGTALFA
jgi:pyridoxal phosphate enzyme (YggS family)